MVFKTLKTLHFLMDVPVHTCFSKKKIQTNKDHYILLFLFTDVETDLRTHIQDLEKQIFELRSI